MCRYNACHPNTNRASLLPPGEGQDEGVKLDYKPDSSPLPNPLPEGEGVNSNVRYVNMNPDRQYMCVICGFVYDEEAGLPEEGFPPGTRWDDIPENWVCPECGAGKQDFEMVEV